ncbi:TlpA disulfide reductase family protein [Glycomyces paridis]|uniref:TlpA family protein disulfide reductase n=1 Tax=Glycomyces paridis TaxID=2126555 RepID=A0A4V6T6G0_9ACTN|nr:TlpA disulfide reductase family protein [Glycomyces paridis]THV31906.1 TlpA family protein disulfide reductase [Glycomyces paridis]
MLAAVPLLAVAACTEADPNANRVNEINRDRYVSGDGRNYRWDDPEERFDAPRLTGEDLQGNAIDTDDWAGSVIVVNFWGSWCAPCVEEAPYLVEAAAEFADQDVRFLGVNIRDSPDAGKAFETRWGVEYPSLNDEAGRIADAFIDYGVSPNNIPATIIIDAEHRVFSIWRSQFDDARTLIADVNEALET